MSAKSSSLPELAHDVLRQAQRPPLQAMFSPSSIAIIGASNTASSVGHALAANIQSFGGSVYFVNPKHPSIQGQTSYPSISAVPGRIDLALIATPAPTVPGIVRECVQAGVDAAIVISAGFRETGSAGAELEQACLKEARRSGMRFLGPNCLGLMVPHISLNASFAQSMPKSGSVAFLSQSGALCTAVLDWSLRENIGFSSFVSIGSMADVGWGDLITYFGDDPQTHSIVCYMESVGDARAFLSAAREVALSKPILVLKSGHTEGAAKAIASHTGAMTGSDAALDAAFRRAGVLRVDSLSELFSMSELLAKQPRPHGPKLTIITNAGGPGAIATDALIQNGGQLAELWPDTINSLNQCLPPHWSRGNPIDVIGDANAERYLKAVEIATHDPQSDGVMVILTPQAMTDTKGTAEAVSSMIKRTQKPILAVWMGGASVDPGRAILNAAGIPTFEYPDVAARAFAMMWRHSQNVKELYETPALIDKLQPSTHPTFSAQEDAHPSSIDIQQAQKTVREWIDNARAVNRTLLTETESKNILSAYGIPVVETRTATTLDEAVHAAQELGWPVVVKLYSKTLTHKTDVGGVKLDLRHADAVRSAWKAIHSSVSAHVGASHFQGVTVQPMVPRGGYELILGSSTDSQFGPTLLFGTGGQLVEVFRDCAVGLPPLNQTLAFRLMEQTKIFRALQGVRGNKAVDLEQLAEVLIRFGQLIVDQRWMLEADINPLLVSSDRIVALDARMVLHPSDTTEAELPHLSIRPYPTQYVRPATLADGTSVLIRPIRPEDEPLMVEFHRHLSSRSVYLRYFAPLNLDQRIAHERLSRICFIDYDRQMVLVVERTHPQTGVREILAVGRLTKKHNANEAEFALTVRDDCQKQGLGTELLRRLVEIGRQEKWDRITAMMLPDNTEMRHIAHKVGFILSQPQGDNVCHAELRL